MCDPVTLIGAAATLGSVGMNYTAAQRQQNARDDALGAERIRQRGFDQEASAINNQSRERYEGIQGQQDEKASGLKDYYNSVSEKVTQPALTDAPIGSKSGGVVAQETAKQSAKAKEFSDGQAGALADKNAFGALFGDISRAQARDAASVGQLAKFKKGSAGVLPLELEAASKSAGGLQMLGDVLGGVGSIGVKAGLGGAGLGGLSSMFGGGSAATGVNFGSVPFNPAADNWLPEYNNIY